MIKPEAAVTKKIKVSDARAQLRLTQMQLADRAGLVHKVIYKAEHGLVVNRISAHAILNALNAERQRQGMPPLEMSDLRINIQGETEHER